MDRALKAMGKSTEPQSKASSVVPSPHRGFVVAGTPESAHARSIADLSARTREIFRAIVETYVETGEPIGSRTLSRRLGLGLSPATIRNVMADLEEAGLIAAPHTSAGRVPTDFGLRLFVDGFLQIGSLPDDERTQIETRCAASGRDFETVLDDATAMLSGLAGCVGVVSAPKSETALRHIEFVHLGSGRALVVIVADNGQVENRVIEVPVGLPPARLQEASNYLTVRLSGRTLDEAREGVRRELDDSRAALDEATTRVVEAGLASWGGEGRGGALIVHGRHMLLDDIAGLEDLGRVRGLFEALERKETLLRLLDATRAGEGVQIFIGADSHLFSLSGCSMVVAPYMNSRERVVGAVGVIGPTRINYARIIPMVDFTAKVIGRLMG